MRQPSPSPALRRARSAISLQTRIAAAALATAACVLSLASALFFFEQWSSDAGDIRRHQIGLAGVVASQATPALTDHAAARRLLRAFSKAESVKQAYLLDAAGQPLAAYDARLRSGDQRRLVQTRAPVLRADGSPGGELVLLAEPDHLARTLPRYFAVSAALFFAATGAALFLGRWLAARLVEPVEVLSRVMRAATETGDLEARAPRGADDEVGRLTDSFNALLDRLQAHDAELRRTLGDLVEARDAAQAANVLKSQFLANVSHEIRTPLNGVLAMAQIMELGELPGEQRARLQVVRDSGESLLNVLNDVLDISKIEAGELVMEQRPFDPGAAAASAAAPFQALAQAKGVAFHVEAAPGLAARVGDETRLRQLVANLSSNAVKFTAAGEVRVILCDAVEDGRDVLALEVSDTGVGIPAEAMSRLFQKFMQADSSTTRRFGGTGLGLAICRELVELMGGRIWAESTPGAGSTFRVRLPLPRAEPAAAPKAAGAVMEGGDPPPADRRALRVLAAEDNAVNRQVLATVLGVFGVEFEMVEDGAAAVQAWAQGAHDVVLMDVQMPVMDGVAAARAIREAEARTGRARIPIIALSANAMTHQVQAYLAAGMDRHVAKPIDLGQLRDALAGAAPDRALAA